MTRIEKGDKTSRFKVCVTNIPEIIQYGIPIHLLHKIQKQNLGIIKYKWREIQIETAQDGKYTAVVMVNDVKMAQIRYNDFRMYIS